MKKRILTWTTLLLSVLCLAVLLTVGVGASDTDTAITTDDSLRVAYGNLVFKDTIYLRYAVSTETYSEADMVLLVWTTPKTGKDEYLYDTQDLTLTATGTTSINGVTHAVFDYKGLTAKQMTDYVYARAYVSADGETEAKYGGVVKYSVLQYSYSMLGKTGTNGTTNEKLIKLINAMLNYGAAAQEYMEYKVDWLANAAFYEVKVVDGTLPDGTTIGLYKKDSTIVLTANAPANGYKFSGWQNSVGETVSTEAVFELTVGEANETYTAVFEEDVKYSEGLEFTSNGDGTCYVSGIGTCTDTEVVIPPVSPEGDKVTKIGYGAFKDQTQLTSVIIPDSVIWISQYAFYGCGNLTYVTIPNGVEHILDYAFYQCVNLRDLIIPESLVKIGSRVFVGCTNLTSLSIPKSVVEINHDAFMGCYGLSYIDYDGSIEQWCQINFLSSFSNPLAHAGKLYINGVLLEEAELSTAIQEIRPYTFYHCTSLKSIEIPNSVKSIGMGAFQFCINLTSVTIPDSVTYIGNSAFCNCYSLTTIQLPAEITTIQYDTFSGCSKLESIVIPDNVTDIGDGAFYNCRSLTSIEIPEGVLSINYGVFIDCRNLKEIIIPNTVESIGGQAFQNCINLTNISIPKSVKSIDWGAFSSCNSLTDVYYEGTQAEWNEIAIGEANSYLNSATIHYNYSPTSVTLE